MAPPIMPRKSLEQLESKAIQQQRYKYMNQDKRQPQYQYNPVRAESLEQRRASHQSVAETTELGGVNDFAKPQRIVQRSSLRKEQRIRRKQGHSNNQHRSTDGDGFPVVVSPVGATDEDASSSFEDERNDSYSYNEMMMMMKPGAYQVDAPSPDEDPLPVPFRSNSLPPLQPASQLHDSIGGHSSWSSLGEYSHNESNGRSAPYLGNDNNRILATTSVALNDQVVVDGSDEQDVYSETGDDDGGECELVIAAELSQDLEREIEARVRRQVMEEAAHASVVGVVVGTEELPTTGASATRVVKEVHPKGRTHLKRTQLPWRVEQEMATGRWVSVVQTNPHAQGLVETQRGERTFVAASKREAIEIAMAMAPPKPQQATLSSSSKECSLCQTTFGLFKRKKHSCINCGITNLCQGCATTWHKSMVPQTFCYHAVDNNNGCAVTVCTACDWSAKTFKDTLLKGDMAEARYMYKHHNVNLRTPFNFLEKKKEVIYPIHAAILGGNLQLVKWFVTNRACPLTTTQTVASNEGLQSSSSLVQPLKTSLGRSPVQLALNRLDILHYLVQDLKFSLLQDDLDPKVVLGHLSLLLQRVPPSMVSNETKDNISTRNRSSSKVMTDYEHQRMERRKLKEAEMRQNSYKPTKLSLARPSSSSDRRRVSHSDRELRGSF